MRGVGSALSSLIPSWLRYPNCSCTAYASHLDSRGLEWCKANQDKIIAHLLKQAKNTRVGDMSERVSKLVATHWVKKAIKMAEKG